MATNPNSALSPAQAARELSKNPPDAKDKAIIGNIENKLGPVGKGKHNEVRTAALLKYVKTHKTIGK